MKSSLVLGVGELLWDLLPATAAMDAPLARLGGAPANFAVMAARLGARAGVLSRIGRDDLGRRAVAALGEMADVGGPLQIDRRLETGRVSVTMAQGEPRYEIHAPAAWDALDLTEEWRQLAERADALCFGSVAQRGERARKTIQTLVAQSSARCLRLFDANLRPPFFTAELLQESLELANLFKCNAAELAQILRLLGLPEPLGDEEEARLRIGARRLLEEFPELNLVAVTRGAQGSLLVGREAWHAHAGLPVVVADTVGAGDAFAAGLLCALLRGATLAQANEAANRCGAWVAARVGAMPSATAAELEALQGLCAPAEKLAK